MTKIFPSLAVAFIMAVSTFTITIHGEPFSETSVEAENAGSAITTAGKWKSVKMDMLSGGAALASSEVGATLEYEFNGAAISADMVVGKSGGMMAVSVDGNPAGTFDMYRGHMNPDAERMVLAGDLKPGAHKIKIEVLDENNPRGFSHLVAIDTLRVADEPYGSISGILECKYNRQMPVDRAKATATGEDYKTDIITDENGAFAFSALPPGTYTLRFERPGFEALEKSGLQVESGKALDLGGVLFEERMGARPLTYIRYPLAVRPVIIRPGDEFPIEVEAPAGASGWSAELENPWAGGSLEISSAEYDSESGRWTVKVKVPSGTASLLYGLRLRFDGGEDFQTRAVKVVPEFKDSIRVVHLTDVHVYKSEMLFDVYQQIAEEVNLVNPDVIIVTGDVTDKPGYTDDDWPETDQYPSMLDLWNSYNAPTFVVPGNHDLSPHHYQEDYDLWNRFFDTTDFGFDVGPYHFTAFDDNYVMISTGHKEAFAEDLFDEQLDWIEKDLAANSGAKMRVLAFHVPLHNLETKVRELAARYDVRLALYGHIHMNLVDQQPPTTYIQTGAAYDGFYRVVNLDNGELGEYSAKKDGLASASVGTIKTRTRISDDERSFSIQVKNSGIMDVPDAEYRVEMPSAAGYTCEGCSIVSQFEKGDKTLVIFHFDIPAKGVAAATLSTQ